MSGFSMLKGGGGRRGKRPSLGTILSMTRVGVELSHAREERTK